jgi:hypothetical protein
MEKSYLFFFGKGSILVLNLNNKRHKDSSKEAHVSTAHTVVGEPSATDHPLGHGTTLTVSTEEVVENGGVEGLNRVLRETIIVGFNFRALVLVRAGSGHFN